MDGDVSFHSYAHVRTFGIVEINCFPIATTQPRNENRCRLLNVDSEHPKKPNSSHLIFVYVTKKNW